MRVFISFPPPTSPPIYKVHTSRLHLDFSNNANLMCRFLTDPWYMEVGESMVNSLNQYTKVEGGFASIKDVATMQLEDHQHSFFLAET